MRGPRAFALPAVVHEAFTRGGFIGLMGGRNSTAVLVEALDFASQQNTGLSPFHAHRFTPSGGGKGMWKVPSVCFS